MIIGSIDILTGINTTGITKGAKAASDAITGFTGKVSGVFAKLSVGVDLGSVFSSLPGKLAEIANKMDEIGDTADRLGLTTEAFSRLSYAVKLTGSDVSILPGALEKFNKNLHDAATNGGPAAAAFNAIGLDAKELVKMDLGKAFLEASDGLSGLPNRADEAAASMAIFGKAGQGLINTFNTDRETLEKFMQESDNIGNTLRDLDRIKVGALFDEFDTLGSVLTGIGQTIVAEVSPYIVALLKYFTDWAKTGTNTGSVVGAVLEGIAKGIGFVADVLQAVSIGWGFFQSAATKAVSVVLKGLGMLANGVDGLLSSLGAGKTGLGEALNQMAAGVASDADQQFASVWAEIAKPPPSEGITSFFKTIRDEANATAQSVFEDNKKTAGASKAFTDNIKEEAEKMKELRSRAKSALESVATPIEKANLQLIMFKELLDKDIIKQEDFDKLVNKEYKDVVGEHRNAATLDYGSKEARSAILEYQAKSQDPQKDLANTAKAQLSQLTRQSGFLDRLVKLQEKEKPTLEVMDF
jgi:hypothetical protein